MEIGRSAISAVTLGILAVAVAPSATANEPDACTSFDVDYAIATSLELRNTRFGAGDGTYPSGSGILRLRVDGAPSAAVRRVRLLSFDARGRFEVVAHALLWATRVVTDARTTVRSNGVAGAATGQLSGGTLTWSTKVSGYRTDGTLSCDGSLCGSFGAPPRGSSPLHEGPYDVDFQPFVFARDPRTFTMGPALVSRRPDQSAFLGLWGREIGRRCVATE